MQVFGIDALFVGQSQELTGRSLERHTRTMERHKRIVAWLTGIVGVMNLYNLALTMAVT